MSTGRPRFQDPVLILFYDKVVWQKFIFHFPELIPGPKNGVFRYVAGKILLFKAFIVGLYFIIIYLEGVAKVPSFSYILFLRLGLNNPDYIFKSNHLKGNTLAKHLFVQVNRFAYFLYDVIAIEILSHSIHIKVLRYTQAYYLAFMFVLYHFYYLQQMKLHIR